MDFIKKWIDVFCKDTDKDKVDKYVIEYDFIWH